MSIKLLNAWPCWYLRGNVDVCQNKFLNCCIGFHYLQNLINGFGGLNQLMKNTDNKTSASYNHLNAASMSQRHDLLYFTATAKCIDNISICMSHLIGKFWVQLIQNN